MFYLESFSCQDESVKLLDLNLNKCVLVSKLSNFRFYKQKICDKMALKPSQERFKNYTIRKYDNQELSKQDNTAVNKYKSKLRKSKSWSQHFYELDFYAEINNNISNSKKPPSEISTMDTYYSPNPVVPNYALPYTWSQWDIIAPQVPSQLYTVPVPTLPLALISPPISIIPTPVVPYTDPYHTYAQVVPYVSENVCTALDQIYEPISSFTALTPVTSADENCEITERYDEKIEPLEFYLTLPKDLFPGAKMLTLDPNPIIDELCKLNDINKHSPWILDLEFGVPRTPISRPLAVYDVQSNNIHCKNTPGAVHPVFEACSEEFRNVLLFYYDCIVSVWYRGYIHLTNDDSVINFQNWLIVPMQALGMCWP